MNRRKLCAALLLALVLLAALPSLAAEELVYFTAVNNNLLELKKETMPVKHLSMIYVPLSVFSSSELGTYSLYSRSAQLALISDREKTLYFDMSSGDCFDGEGEQYKFVAQYVNSTAYVPAYFAADFFGIGYSYYRGDTGHLVRLTKGQYLEDADFWKAASDMMATRLQQYQREQAQPEPTLPPTARPTQRPVQTPKPTPTPSSAPPATPSPAPSPVPTPTVTPPRDRSHVSVYLAFLGVGPETETLLDELEQAAYSACFFADAAQLAQYPDTVRRILGEGFSLGVLLQFDPAAEYAAAAKALRGAAMSVTFLAAGADELEPEAYQAALDTGLRLWSAEEGIDSLTVCEAFLITADTRCDLVLDGAFAHLPRLLRLLEQENYTVSPITELTETRLRYAALF